MARPPSGFVAVLSGLLFSLGTASAHTERPCAASVVVTRGAAFFASLLGAAPALASRQATTRQDGGGAGERWQSLSYLGGTGTLGPAHPGDVCDLVLQDGRLELVAPSTGWQRCSLTGKEIRGDAITWLGYARGSGRSSSGLAGPLELFFTPLGPSHFMAIGFRDSTGGESSVTFSYYSRVRGSDVDARLRFLSRISGVPILASQEDVTKLPADLPKTVSTDPLRVLVPDVPLWRARQIAIPAASNFLMTPDRSAVLTDKGLYSVPEGRLLCTLPSDLRKSVRYSAVKLAAISADGRTLVAVHNTGAANGKAALRAGHLTLVDIATGKSRGGTGVLPYLRDVVRSADATRAFATHATLDHQPGGEPTLSAVDLDRAEVVWRAALPGEPRGARAWGGGVVVFGATWVRVWRDATAESLLGPTSVLQDLPAGEQPTRIEDAYVVDAPARLFVVYVSKASGSSIAEVEVSSGKTVRTVRVPSGFRSLCDNGAVLLVWSREGRVLWDGVALRPLGPLLGQKSVSGVSFDASGRQVATAGGYSPLRRSHLVVWDVATQRAVGQCFLEDSWGDVHFLAGHTVLASGRDGMVLCQAPESGR